jgi:hypothetical protein
MDGVSVCDVAGEWMEPVYPVYIPPSPSPSPEGKMEIIGLYFLSPHQNISH